MKLLKYALIIPILIGCSSKNNSFEVLKANAKSYEEIANTEAYRSKDAIVFFTLKDRKLKIDLIDKRSENEELELLECKINKLRYLPIKDFKNQEIGKHYYIVLKKRDKRLKIKCKLNNNEVVKVSLKRYWD